MTLFASCAPGLEGALLAEARALPGLAAAAAEPGGVLLSGTAGLAFEANLRLRSAGRVLLRLGRFRASRLPQLLEAAAALPWERYLRGPAITASVTCHRCRIYHSGAAAERLGLGVAARLGGAAAAGGPKVLLRGVDDEWEVSLDSSGELLHRRGYRLEQGEAPLRETLAAGLLLLAGYRGGPLLDLCTGAGTFAIEAGMMARRLLPGLGRRFAFEDWPGLDAEAFTRAREAARAEALPAGEGPTILGVDLDGRAIERAAENARRAGLGGEVAFRQGDLFLAGGYGDFLAAQERAGLFVSANPPYGRRLGPRESAAPFYRRLGRHLRVHLGGARALILSGHRHGAASLGLGLPALRLKNGGLPIEVLAGVIPAS